MASLEEVVRKYPTTEYAISAKRKIEVARDQLAGKEMDIGRWYMERRNYTGAINRFKVVVTRYQTTRHVEEALLEGAPARAVGNFESLLGRIPRACLAMLRCGRKRGLSNRK